MMQQNMNPDRSTPPEAQDLTAILAHIAREELQRGIKKADPENTGPRGRREGEERVYGSCTTNVNAMR